MQARTAITKTIRSSVIFMGAGWQKRNDVATPLRCKGVAKVAAHGTAPMYLHLYVNQVF